MSSPSGTIRLLTWNIQHGGGALRTPWIALALVEARADIVVLTEFRATRGGQIRGALADHGLVHQAVSAAAAGANAVLLASRWPLESSSVGPPGPGRVIAAHVPALDLRVIGAHIPPPGWGGAVGERREAERQRVLAWQAALDAARACGNGRAALLGDFNCGRAGIDGSSFRHTALLGQLATLGYIDAWRHLHPVGREMTWHGPRGACGRIDHCFLSAAMAGGLRACWIDDFRSQAGPDKAAAGAGDSVRRLSDHAPVVVEVDVEQVETEAEAVGKGLASRQKQAKMWSVGPDFVE